MIKIRYIGRSHRPCFLCDTTKSVRYAIDLNEHNDIHICNKCFAMKFSSENGVEIDLFKGLSICAAYDNMRLYSDGLQSNEYIHYVKGIGLCYEDGARIGKDEFDTLTVLDSLEWTRKSKFFLRTEE